MELPEEWRAENSNLRISNNVVTVSLRKVKHGPCEAKIDLEDDGEGDFYFDLHQLSRQMAPLGGQYNLRRFAAIIRNTRNPPTAILQFANGRIVCTGASTLNRAEFVLRRHLQDLHRLGYPDLDFRKETFVVQNVVGSAKLPDGIDLDQLARDNPGDCMYTKDLFPGAALRQKGLKKMTVLVFPSGCIVVTGGKSREDLIKALEITLPTIYACRKRDRRRGPRRALGKGTLSASSQEAPQKKRRIGRGAMQASGAPSLPDRSNSALF